jgi:hypothetical protein
MASDLQNEVQTIMAGATLQADVTLADFPAETGATLRYAFRSGLARVFADAVGNTQTGAWAVQVAASETAKLEPGNCIYSALHTDPDGVVEEADSGTIIIRHNPGIVSHAERMLNAIRAVMENRATTEQVTISLGDVQLQYMTPDELRKWESKYESQVIAEQNRQHVERGGRSRYSIGTRFV